MYAGQSGGDAMTVVTTLHYTNIAVMPCRHPSIWTVELSTGEPPTVMVARPPPICLQVLSTSISSPHKLGLLDLYSVPVAGDDMPVPSDRHRHSMLATAHTLTTR